jgi:uncharacterized protein (UPF0333 family)
MYICLIQIIILGAMAGLAFGMLIMGILLAAGIYFGIAKFRGKPLDGMAVSFVKQDD